VIRTDTTGQIIGAAIKVHRKLGPGLLESAYEACLAYELEKLGLHVQRQKAVPLVYETVKLECGFRADLVVEGRIVVEIKGKEALHRERGAPSGRSGATIVSPAIAQSSSRPLDQLSCRPTQGRN